MYNKKIDYRFRRLSKEVTLRKDEQTVSRTDIKGNILYFNNTFSKISGYTRKELTQVPHSILRHHDMPKTIFYMIWKTLLAGHNTNALIKNLTKEGDYYWQIVNLSVQKNNQNNTISFLSQGKQANQEIIKEIEPIYQELREIERYNTDDAIRFFLDFLNRNNIATYNDYISRVEKEKKHTPMLHSWLKF